MKRIFLSSLAFAFIFLLVGCDSNNPCTDDPNEPVDYKPVLYIYPTEDINVNVTLKNKDNLLTTYQ